MFNGAVRHLIQQLNTRLESLESVIKDSNGYCHLTVRPYKHAGLESKVKELQKEVDKLKAIVAEVTNKVYAE